MSDSQPEKKPGVGKKVWLAFLKKADDATPARISFLKKPLHQCLAVVVLFAVFFASFAVSVVSNTAGCSVENGCVTCVVESNVNDEVESQYSLGCEPIAVPSFGLEQLNGCATGLVKNDKTELMELIGAGEELISKLTALCEHSMAAKCADGTTTFQEFYAGNGGNTIGDCVERVPDQCYALDNTYFPYVPADAIRFPRNAEACEGIFASWVDAWENSLVSGALKNAAVWSSTDSLIDFNVEELEKIHTSFGYYTPTKMKSVAVGYMLKMAQIKCWIDQLYEELVASPEDYPESSYVDDYYYGRVRSIPIMANSADDSKAMLLQPGEYSGSCGVPLASLTSLGEYTTSVYGGASTWWVASVQEVRPEQTSPFRTIVAVQSLDTTVCRHDLHDNYQVKELCDDSNQYRATGTGEFSCCSEMSATNVLSAGYAFAGVAMSAAGVFVAVAVYAMCGKAMVDMDELKRAAKAGQRNAGEMHTVASSAAAAPEGVA